MRRLIIASSNKHKIEEFKNIFKDINYEIMGLDDIGFTDDIVEDGDSFISNASIKAEAVYKFWKEKMSENDLILADDSGLSCDLLNGAPGIYSARFKAELSVRERNEELCKLLRDKDEDENLWTCHYTAAIVLIDSSGSENIFEKHCYGRIKPEPRGENGFGYDPIFFLPEYGLTMAELASDMKNSISHRGKACREVLEFIRNREVN